MNMVQLKDALAVIRADKDVRSADSLKAKRLKRQGAQAEDL